VDSLENLVPKSIFAGMRTPWKIGKKSREKFWFKESLGGLRAAFFQIWVFSLKRGWGGGPRWCLEKRFV